MYLDEEMEVLDQSRDTNVGREVIKNKIICWKRKNLLCYLKNKKYRWNCLKARSIITTIITMSLAICFSIITLIFYTKLAIDCVLRALVSHLSRGSLVWFFSPNLSEIWNIPSRTTHLWSITYALEMKKLCLCILGLGIWLIYCNVNGMMKIFHLEIQESP